ncbi:MAG: sulfotransferase family protein [Pseudomonadota bacterium]
MVMPNFLIIGSGRSGTTSLHAYLAQHPEVYMSPLKETNFFALEERTALYGGPGAKWLINSSISTRRQYEALFDAVTTQKAIGESSPRYLYTPAAMENIKRTLPDVKLIAVLRNPVDRAYASYMGMRRDGWEKCPDFAQAIADEPRRIAENWLMGCYLSVGYYHAHLSRVYRLFDPAQIRIYLYEDLQDRLADVLADIFAFIGVDTTFTPDMSHRHNVSGIIRNPLLRALWTKTILLRTMMRPLVPYGLRHWAGRAIVREVEKEALAPRLRAELIARYREDILLLERLINRDLRAWLQCPEDGQAPGAAGAS